MATEMSDAHTKAVMVGIAQSYEDIAEWLEEPAHRSDRSLCESTIGGKDYG
jgi:hypothetical protein